MPYTYSLTPEPQKPLSDDIVQALSRLAELLAEHFGSPTHCRLDLHLEPDLRVDRVLQSLQIPKEKQDLVERIRHQIRSQVGDLSTSQIERMVDSALHGVGIQIGMIMGSEALLPQSPRARRRIFSCSVCDEVFIDEESLQRHLVTHNE